jgi:hypothetical protein
MFRPRLTTLSLSLLLVAATAVSACTSSAASPSGSSPGETASDAAPSASESPAAVPTETVTTEATATTAPTAAPATTPSSSLLIIIKPSAILKPQRGFVATGDLVLARGGHTATLLPNGKVLIVGGISSEDYPSPVTSSAELYLP